MDDPNEPRDSVRSLWAWGAFALLLLAGIALFFLYVPR